MNVYLLANMATQHGGGTQTPRIKRVDLRTPFQVFLAFIITLLTAMKCLFVLKPLSVKLQKRDLDVYEAYTNSNNVTDDLQDIRDNIEDIWTEWFDLAVTTAANVGVVPTIPRRTNQQQHRDNVPAQTPSTIRGQLLFPF